MPYFADHFIPQDAIDLAELEGQFENASVSRFWAVVVIIMSLVWLILSE